MKLFQVTIILAVVLLAAGCGGSSGSGSDTESSSASSSSTSEIGSSSSEITGNSSSSVTSSMSSSLGVSSSHSSTISSSSSSSSLGASSRGETSPIVETEPENWYVRLLAEASARGLTTENAQIGQLNRPDAASENLDTFEPFSGGYIDIVIFEGDSDKGLKGSFHIFTADASDGWRFAVETDDEKSNVILSWRGLYKLTSYVDDAGRTRYREQITLSNPLLERMQLVDESSGEAVAVMHDGGKSYLTFNMDGQTRRYFRWELLTEPSQASATVSAVEVQYARSLFKGLESAKPKPFDLTKPPVVIMPGDR